MEEKEHTKDNIKFNSLTPEVLTENKVIYTKALDYAFSNKDIKNIAITGIYGAGKSTVWKTYVNYKINDNSSDFKNTITVSLGRYLDDFSNVEEKSENYEILNNRIERQLINQILSQIKADNISLSKYRFKSNTSLRTLIFDILSSVFLISSILLYFLKITTNLYVVGALFFIPVLRFLYFFYKEKRISISKINLKGTEANFNEDNKDETVLDRDIKEIVYLLNSSSVSIVVFEDLDRYDNVEIFTKLRELNFLLNSFIQTNGNGRIVRFVYMIKDSLFFSKNRTKFFDFIVPIVPVIDSKTSENKLIDLFKDVNNAPDEKVIRNISLYVDDMRILKNIVNEYIIYSNIIPLEKINLDCNKLFALMVLKNIFPNEFDLLQEDKGFIKNVFDTLENKRTELKNQLLREINEKKEEIKSLKKRLSNDKFEAMSLMIQANVSLFDSVDGKTWSEIFKEWSAKPNEDKRICKNNSYLGSINYNEFLKTYIFTNQKKKELITNLLNNKMEEIENLNFSIKNIQRQIQDIDIYSYQKLISSMNEENRNNLFSTINNEIITDHYFPLIRFLISEGLVDETYWYYKGDFDVDKSNTLKQNDTIYVKNLLEGKKNDIFLKVETPREIIKRLNNSDFLRFNILNKNILEVCLEEHNDVIVLNIMKSVDTYNNYSNLIKVLNEYKISLIKNCVDILLESNINILVNILENNDLNNSSYRNLLIMILENKDITENDLNLFKKYIEPNEDIISLIQENEIENILNNIRKANIKFNDLTKSNCNKEQLTAIERIQAYRINVKNIMYIASNILDKDIIYGNLLNDIYQSPLLTSSKRYVDNNFETFVSDYIHNNKQGYLYTNSEEIISQVLNSDISDEYKLKYAENNEVLITNLNTIKDIISDKLLNYLFYKNIVKLTSENINVHSNMAINHSKAFIRYLEKNLNKDNSVDILSDSKILCNSLINNPVISDKLFDIVIDYTDKKIKKINTDLSRSRINILLKRKLITVNIDNIELLMNHSYFKEIGILIHSDSQDIEDKVITQLIKKELSNDLIYELINSDISDENANKLIDKIEDDILIDKINPSKLSIIENVINRGLSHENIEYICKTFNTFYLKDVFLLSLENSGELEDIDDKYLNDNLMKYILKSEDFSSNTKTTLIITKIKNKADVSVLKEYISTVNEIAELSTVWSGKRPILDNSYKKLIGDELIEAGYVKRRADHKNGYFRIEMKK